MLYIPANCTCGENFNEIGKKLHVSYATMKKILFFCRKHFIFGHDYVPVFLTLYDLT